MPWRISYTGHWHFQRTNIELCWEGISEVISWHWSHDPDGKPDGNHLAKDSFWTISMNTNPWFPGPHSKKLWICRFTVLLWKESSENPIFFSWCFFPKPMFRSPELKTSHSLHKALSVVEDLGHEFRREVKAGIRQRKHQYLRFSL